MSEQLPDDHISKKRVVYQIAGMERAVVRRELIFRTTDDGPLTLDLYSPERPDRRPPVVVLVEGYNDVGFARVFGCRFKEMGMAVSWAQLLAASGLSVVAYTNRDPASDLDALLTFVGDRAPELGIDGDRVGLFATSGHVPLALAALMNGGRGFLRCAAFFYGYMLDLDGATGVAEAAATFRFTHPNTGRSMADVREELPLFVARAGQDQFAGLNDSIDRFAAKALAANRPITVVNHAAAPHAFDLLHDSETSREIIRQALGFMRSHLYGEG
jgi:dienelactone hydrolase